MKNILHADDEETWRSIFTDEVDGVSGIKLQSFSTPEDALSAIEKNKFDIVISDLHFGEDDRSGYRIAEAAKKVKVQDIIIASDTITPSERMDGVTIQDKNATIVWLRNIVHGLERG